MKLKLNIKEENFKEMFTQEPLTNKINDLMRIEKNILNNKEIILDEAQDIFDSLVESKKLEYNEKQGIWYLDNCYGNREHITINNNDIVCEYDIVAGEFDNKVEVIYYIVDLLVDCLFNWSGSQLW